VSSAGIVITLKPAYLKYGYLYVAQKDAAFFPAGAPFSRKEIRLEVARGVFAAELQYNSKARI